MGFMNEPSMEELEEIKQRKAAQLEIEEKKALIVEAKKRYGSDWKRMLNLGSNGTVKSGIDWQSLKFKL